MLVIRNTMGSGVGLLSVSGTWSVNLPPQPFELVPVFPQVGPSKTMTGGGGSSDAANAGACAATAITGTVQAAPRTTVRRE